MVSFDVVSLFTNIPTVETIEIILDEAFKEKEEYFNNLNREELKKLLIICTQKSQFTIEHEDKNRLPFFDTLVGRHKDRYPSIKVCSLLI